MTWTEGLIAGQTPLDPDEAGGLIPAHISFQAELNEWEQLNIVKGQRWAFRQKKADWLDELFVRELHRQMFGATWRWAGVYRNTDKTIGVPSERVSMLVHQLLRNTRYQVENKSFAPDELAVRFHHALVSIHPFPNGNGRHSRMLADLLVTSLGHSRFSWGGRADLGAANDVRGEYIGALRAADANDFTRLLVFARL